MRIIKKIPIAMTTSLIMLSGAVSAIDFNTDAMDANDKQNIDLSHLRTLAISCRVSIGWRSTSIITVFPSR